MKKILSLLLIFSLILCPCTSVSAEGTPTVKLTDATVFSGSTFTIDVIMTNNPGVNSFSLGFEYDAEALELLSVTIGDDISGQFIYIKKAVFLGSLDFSGESRVAKLTFKALEGFKGDTYVSPVFTHGDMCNYDEEIIDFEKEAGKVTVVNYLRGDVNADGKVNATDSNELISIILGKTEMNEINSVTADINADNKINASDQNELIRIIVGKS